MGEHGEWRADEVNAPYQLVLTTVNIDAIDLQRGDVERVERTTLAG